MAVSAMSARPAFWSLNRDLSRAAGEEHHACFGMGQGPRYTDAFTGTPLLARPERSPVGRPGRTRPP